VVRTSAVIWGCPSGYFYILVSSVRRWPGSNTGTCGLTGRSGKSTGFQKQSGIIVSFLDCINTEIPIGTSVDYMMPAGTCFDCINKKVPVGTCFYCINKKVSVGICSSKLLISDRRNKLGDEIICVVECLKSKDKAKIVEVTK